MRIGSGYYGSRGFAPVRFYRPYYAFRPRLSLGFGLWVGYPVVYPSYYSYYDPYDYYSYDYPGYPSAYPAYPYPSTVYPSYPYPPSSYPANPYPPNQYPVPAYPQGGTQGYPSNSADTGGVSFEISPPTAEVFVDGAYVGTVGQFTPSSQALGLSPGRHRLEIRAPGYRTMSVDVDIVPGQVIPYRGQMER